MDYVVDLEEFYGPLDLLLYLIEKQEVDIYNIPVAVITDQYINYIDQIGAKDLNQLGDFLIMASYLLSLKARLLLPGPNSAEEQEKELGDPREELVKKLIDYKKYKTLAALLSARLDEGFKRVYFRDCPGETEVDVQVRVNVRNLARVFEKLLKAHFSREDYTAPQGDFNIEEKMEFILNYLPSDGGRVPFSNILARSENRREGISFFLALLELVRLKKVEAIQEHQGAEINLLLGVALKNADAR